MFRDTFAVELLLAGVPIDQVSTLLGHSSVKMTETHYLPWVKARQEQLTSSVVTPGSRGSRRRRCSVGFCYLKIESWGSMINALNQSVGQAEGLHNHIGKGKANDRRWSTRATVGANGCVESPSDLELLICNDDDAFTALRESSFAPYGIQGCLHACDNVA